MRHAKSSWDDASLSDFERPLNARGLRTAPFMGRLMADKGFSPAMILSSPAERAKQTAVLVKEAAAYGTAITFDPSIYEASTNKLRQIISAIDDEIASLMLVGHNPGMEGMVQYLCGQIEPMPTAALAVIELNIEKWIEINDGCGNLLDILRPKDVMG